MDNSFTIFVKNNKRLWKIGLLIAAGIILILLSSSFGKESGVQSDNKLTLAEYKSQLEDEIASICSSVEGVGKCRVIITFERGEQNSYKGTSVIETKPPRVLGVTVVCRGADSDAVRYALVDMLTALFDVSSSRIAILKLNS